MNLAWATSLDQLWRTAPVPMWGALIAIIAFALVLLVTLIRAERSVANGVLAVLTLLAIGVASMVSVRGVATGGTGAPSEVRAMPAPIGIAALSCLDGLAGDAVESACERALFGAPDMAAAAVSYTAGQITRLAGYGDQAAADRVMTPELAALRRAVERDRYGLVAQVLSTRDGCTPSECDFYKSLSDHNQIAAAMTDRTYAGLVGRYALTWAGPAQAAAPAAPPALAGAPAAAAVGAVPPPGKPVSGDFPSSASIPPVNIMASEPAGKPAAAARPAPAAATAAAQPAAPAAAAPKVAPRNADAAAPQARRPAPKKPPAAASTAPAQAGPTPQRDPLAPSAQRDDN
ncbi:hypothetical protein JQ557_34985 [Bradyrhizobium sp. U87765 SZCCT0131]|uniref:hypothetical protein n=1 Tax=unclassified Bradyrhizobium TaxID=2631580 RepID=UPI001BA4BB12|nr:MULTISPECIES: hypothetical protein [unclassified Bradyrhizobium]MBR1223249.1 hypothetical protein [Bradyrhizobium sp. U87765 SZCCT0131]MBR1265781.1 hypothetical protein [Bradyrhizobium sp. U87765 SZCCT0134]MBR1309248.1 hypothetical protein [Bradyrhizobium sp. U87765 SZCCT0110]MBR1323173.1 hypothetical protein [Bradyrhizobium sp. U87765 SZCCT0109]MBR1352474.1 hypothetical protein [Bradyrhizobium sp. U87765 SZCCT0048]